MKLDSKTILTIGAGAVVGYLIFCKYMKSDAEKSLEGGAEAPSEGGGGGGGGFGGGGYSPMPILPIVTPIVNPIVLPNGGTISRQDASISNVQSGNSPIASGDASANVGRETPPPPVTKPPITDVSGAPVSRLTAKFTDFDGTDFDGNMNQDRIL
jgi:hypothetical protein